MLDMASIIVGAVIGSVTTVIVERLWDKTEKYVDDKRKPKIPFMGYIAGVPKKKRC